MAGATTLLRKTIKAAVLPAGLARRRREGDLVVLLYHTVGAHPAEIDVPREEFERQLAWLASTGLVRSLGEALADGGGGVVVTFDDGYRDFPETVLPLLERYRIPSMLYLATGLVTERGDDANGDRLDWADVRAAVATGLVTIGSHTHGHVDLSNAGEAVAEDEMRRSKELIEDHLGTACRHFAYPWALASPAAELVARRHFDSAALPAWRTNRRGRTEPLRLGRTPVLRSDTGPLFRAKAAGMLDGEAIAYRLMRRGPWGRRP
jgi:peptidoglycan/xylan/chitin deacetylase (PgdA/CDA1 family)